jgi:hypothetical protein
MEEKYAYDICWAYKRQQWTTTEQHIARTDSNEKTK